MWKIRFKLYSNPKFVLAEICIFHNTQQFFIGRSFWEVTHQKKLSLGSGLISQKTPAKGNPEATVGKEMKCLVGKDVLTAHVHPKDVHCKKPKSNDVLLKRGRSLISHKFSRLSVLPAHTAQKLLHRDSCSSAIEVS